MGKVKLCECGCGMPAPIAKQTDRKNGRIKGKPLRFISGHQNQRGDKNPRFKHGLTGTSFYIAWNHMKNRCLNPKDKDFRYYGGRGIKVCDEWTNFINFKKDMYENYIKHKETHKTTTIDRINNDGNYESGNCRWATRREQNANSSAAKWFIAINPEGEIFKAKNQTAFGHEHNLRSSLINMVLKGKLPHHKKWTFKYVIKEDL